jgi:hypothetical protein
MPPRFAKRPLQLQRKPMIPVLRLVMDDMGLSVVRSYHRINQPSLSISPVARRSRPPSQFFALTLINQTARLFRLVQ